MGTGVKRRGILAAAAAAAAALMAKQVALPVSATGATGNSDGGALIIGAPGTVAGNQANTTAQQTKLLATAGATLPAGSDLFFVDATARTAAVGAIRGQGALAGSTPGIGITGLGGSAQGPGDNSGGRGIFGVGGSAFGAGQPGTGVMGQAADAAFLPPVTAGVSGVGGRRGVLGMCSAAGGSGLGVQGITDNLYSTGTDNVLINAGVSGIGKTTGVQGDVDLTSSVNNSAGVRGINKSSGIGGAGVLGQCDTANGFGVKGTSTIGTGVRGNTTTGFGVAGSTSDPHGTGVIGSSGGGGAAGDGNGVYGFVHHVGSNQVTAGVFGDSDASYGIIGRTTAAGYSGCTGIANTPNTAAFAGAGAGGAICAFFTGPTVVQGDFTVVGGAKNAAVKHTDGSYRLLHCVESPEPWFEDFGEGKLVGGKAEVKLDADFAAVVDTAEYRVFVVPEGDCNGLWVTAKTAAGFGVRELRGGTGTLTFSWRVVARRKDLGKVQRLAKFAVPQIRLPKPEELPKHG